MTDDERIAQIRELATKPYSHHTMDDWNWMRILIPELLTLVDEQKKRIEELEEEVGETKSLADGACDERDMADGRATAVLTAISDALECHKSGEVYTVEEIIAYIKGREAMVNASCEREGDAEARASRAEQALTKCEKLLLPLTDGEVCGDCPATTSSAGVAAPLSTERERVIQECREIVRKNLRKAGDEETVIALRILDDIEAAASLPTPPLQTQTRTKTWAYVIELRLYICGVCDYAGDTEDDLEEHDCHVSPPEEEKA